MVKKNSAIIVGAGISGSCTAHHLRNAGWDITLIDEMKENFIQIFSNPAICVYPKIMLNDPSFNRLTDLSTKYVWKLLKSIHLKGNQAKKVGAIHLYDALEGAERYAKIIKNTIYSNQDVTLLSQDEISERYGIVNHVGFFFNNGGWIQPKALCNKLITDKGIKTIYETKIVSLNKEKDLWTVITEDRKKLTAYNIIFCTGSGIKNFKYFSRLNIEEYRGQVDWIDNDDLKYSEILSNDGYVIPHVGKKMIFGSSYDKNNNNTKKDNADTSHNLQKLAVLLPELKKNQCSPETNSWVGQRAASYDRKPYVGKVLQFGDKPILSSKYSSDNLSWHEGLYVNACYGSRGFSFAPLVSLSLANLITGNLNNDDKFILNYLNPERKFFKKIGIKKKGIDFDS